MSDPASYERICAAAEVAGLACRGGFHPGRADEVPSLSDGTQPATVILLGFAGASHWERFSGSPELGDGDADPLDRWSKRIIGELSKRFEATALYPTGPPWLPFQRWAQRAEGLRASPLGILIHPRFGLWHAYRGALALRERIGVPLLQGAHPCDDCAERPCLSACPVGAVRARGFDQGRCAERLAAPDGHPCRSAGCIARASCPVGAEFRYGVEQSAFHMRALLRPKRGR
ncbi:MAG TPA: hypothetical protein VME21_00375 [Steroidobacteraceae bacterium]|nr:hypothetical protein [Steroidobacteraceae bacterium]